MGKEFPLVPRDVPKVSTKYRVIDTPIPVPASIPRFERLRLHEPVSMGGQPPIVWNSGRGFCIEDGYGNKFLDVSSGVLSLSMGVGHPGIMAAILRQTESGIYSSYCFANPPRFLLIDELARILPDPLKKIFLVSTGSEATECAIKVARTFAIHREHSEKTRLVTFINAFHGRTMGAQLAGGWNDQKAWIPGNHPEFVNVPFPDGFRMKDTSFAAFEQSLAEQGVDPSHIFAVMSETYQGCNAQMWPVDYARAMRKWCDRHGILLILDEVQAGFGRTGKMFGFQHLGIMPDVIACGKGISGGMPLSAVIGRAEIMDIYGPGAMTSTHSANPIACAATLANLLAMQECGAVDNAAALGKQLAAGIAGMKADSRGRIGHVASIGLVAAVQFVKPGSIEPDPDTAWEVVRGCVDAGIMMFAPVGVGGGAIKINPPLIITADALQEALEVISEVTKRVCAS